MKFNEYKKAATRHLITCHHLLKDISTAAPEKKKNLLLNTYYLSGYVIETCLSYAFFSHINYLGEIEESIDYRNGFRTHRFTDKVQFILRKNGDLSGLPFINQKHQDNRLNLLYAHWSTDFRYSCNNNIKDKDLTEEIIFQYIKNVEIILNVISKRF